MKGVVDQRSNERGAQGRFRLAHDIKIESGLEKQRQSEAPSHIDGQDVQKFGQASYDGGTAFKSTWKPGFLYLTDNRILFIQGMYRLIDIPLIDIERITVVTRDWVPGRRVDQLCLIRKKGGGRRTLYMRVPDPQGWKDALEKRFKEAQSKEKEETIYADRG